MWVNLTNSEQFIISCCIVRTVKIVGLTVCWLFDWTASQLVKFLYWFCLTECIIWNWKWCYLYCLTSVMQGNRLEESDWIPQQLFYCFSYIVIWCDIKSVGDYMCLDDIEHRDLIWLNTITYRNVDKGIFNVYIENESYL